MRIKAYTAKHYADAMKSLLPKGLAWQWPINGLGYQILLACAKELERIDLIVPTILQNAIDQHKPAYQSWHIDEYRRVANQAVVAQIQRLPARYCSAGSRVGDRLFSAASVNNGFQCPLVQVDHFIKPLSVYSQVGDRTWSSRARVLLRVRYLKGFVDPKPVFDALLEFKQAHVFLWFEDLSGVGGELNYAQN